MKEFKTYKQVQDVNQRTSASARKWPALRYFPVNTNPHLAISTIRKPMVACKTVATLASLYSVRIFDIRTLEKQHILHILHILLAWSFVSG